MDERYPGHDIRTRTAIEQTSVTVLAVLLEPGVPSPGPPGAEHVDNARFRIERRLSPAGPGVARISGEVTVSYTRQVFPAPRAEAPLERGASYALFCSVLGPHQLHALKIVAHSEDAVRIVARAFGDGARHESDPASSRLA